VVCAAVALIAAAGGHWQVDRIIRPVFAPDHVQWFAGQRAVIRGSVVDRPVRRATSTRLMIEVAAVRRGGDWQAASGRVLVTVRGVSQPWRVGDRLEALLGLRRPRNFGNPGEFDYEAYLARRGVYLTAFATSDRGWARTAAAPDPIERWRIDTVHLIERTLAPPVAAIVGALLVGDAIPLPDAVRDRYARAGVSHVLSISGLHVALVATSAFAALRWLLGRSERVLLGSNVPKLAMTASVAPIALYAAIAGDNVATLRAELMAVLVVAAVLLDRPRDWLACLAAAAAAISVAWPGALFEISFQLSFAAMLAIILGMRRITPWWDRWEEAHLVRLRGRHWRWVRWIVLTEAVTVCATLGTAPLTVWHFNQVSVVALIANPIVVPLLGGSCVGVGLLATAAAPLLPGVAAMLFTAVGVLTHLADLLVQLCAAVPGGSVRLVTPSGLELALTYAVLGILAVGHGARRRILLVGCAVVLTADAGYWAARRSAPGALEVTFVSVGQGDCALVEFPTGEVMVVDGGGLGGSFDVGRQVVAPLLWRRKIRRIDVLVLTHADFDHYGGLPFLIDAFSPATFWWNGRAGAGGRFAALPRALQAAGTRVEVAARGMHRSIGGVDVTVLHPSGDFAGSDNDGSLTVQLRYAGIAVLLPGDLQADGERSLVTAAGQTVRSTLLKVPHHGSRTSSSATLLDAVAPRIAVISAGADNRFAFPHGPVLESYRRRGIAVYRTDRDGAVSVRITPDGAIAVTTGAERRASADHADRANRDDSETPSTPSSLTPFRSGA
jgi:competence protein ComEC